MLRALVSDLEERRLRYALIGGFAMAMHGVQRATMDLDFILMLEDMNKAHQLLIGYDYQRVFRSENVSHYQSEDDAWGRIDILHAFRGPSLGMLKRAELVKVGAANLSIRVATIEDIIGLKIQAFCNNPSRLDADWQDVLWLTGAAKEMGKSLDWDLLEDYFCLFKQNERLEELKQCYGASDRK